MDVRVKTIKKAVWRRIDAFELWCWRRLESPLDCKEIQPVLPTENQSWIFIGRTDVKAETPNFGHLMRRTDSFETIPKLGKIEGGRRRGQQRMRWLDGNQLNGYDFEYTPGVGDGQGGLVCRSPWVQKWSDTIEWLNWTDWKDRDNMIKSYLFLYLPQIWFLNS